MDRYEQVVLTNMCMVQDAEGRFLLQDRIDPNWGGLVFPGGHVEPGESFCASVIREVQEETGITIRNPRLCRVKQFTDGEGRRYIVFMFKAFEFSGEIRGSSEGGALWLTEAEISARKTVPKFCDLMRAFQDDSFSELFYDINDMPHFCKCQ